MARKPCGGCLGRLSGEKMSSKCRPASELDSIEEKVMIDLTVLMLALGYP